MSGLLSACLICCAAAFIFFIALAIYSIARGRISVNVMSARAGPNGPLHYDNGQDASARKLEAIRGSEKVLCDKCGEWADSGDGFCRKCGEPLEKR